MLNRIDQKFINLDKEKKKALVAFVTSGDPDFHSSKKIINSLPKFGADFIEIGIPFSDPMADGPTIQRSSQRAIKSGINLAKTFKLIENFRENAQKRVKLGIILNKLIEEHELKADADRVKKLIEERSKNYKEPEKVVNWYYSNEEQLKNIESLALEEQVTELLEKEGKSTDESMDFDKVLGINV